ncbi:hypothetical protein N0B31_01025 [Salinirubellus salinus]|jgi:hypothetical protein|uniref:Molybdopterin cofactor biosynthesis MoaD-related C-terminal domain-containing protein n=2 Tax=Salinirubellus salinus TaxID=1364945 RepID=A0A9E7R327_9EURY|nr:hypothetical protein [Salinirubellus salinus]UWM54876.1 hypothetical protein N0B31_01025 [Salinirubellus salinus]
MERLEHEGGGAAFDARRATLAGLPPVERTVADGTLHETRRFRGLSREQAIGYLTHLGGTRRDAHTVTGDGWEATLTARKVPVGPSYRLTEVTISWVGDRAVLEDVILHFRLKAFRAPG